MDTAQVVIVIILPVSLLACFAPGYCGDEEAPQGGWKNEIVVNLSLTQASFDNWTQGGENTLGWQATLNAKFTNLGEGHRWSNAARVAYGMTKIGDQESRKSVDEIRLESVFTYGGGYYVDPYVAATVETQFTKGYKYADSDKTAISDSMDPIYFTQSAGIGRSHRDVIRTRLGFSLKETVTDDFPVPYTDDPETPDRVEKTRAELGLESVTELNLKAGENLHFASRLELFSNLEASNQIDVTWDNLLTAKVEQYVSVTLNVRLFYDRHISEKRQLKQALALGLTYSFL